MTKWHGGKGSLARKVDNQKFKDNWDAIFKNKKDVDSDKETTKEKEGKQNVK